MIRIFTDKNGYFMGSIWSCCVFSKQMKLNVYSSVGLLGVK